MATAILKEIFDIEIIRTRDKNILNELDLVYDVGGGKFDHHDVNKEYRNDGIPYAASGLIWKEFGREVINFKEHNIKDKDIDDVVEYIDNYLIKGIDAIDNGVEIHKEEIPIMNISSIISGFNPLWNSNKSEDVAFGNAVKIASYVLNNTINNRLAILKGRDIVVKAYNKRITPEILVLDKYCPWQETLKKIDKKKEVFFVIYPNKNRYTLTTVKEKNRHNRKSLPKSWAGRVGKELEEITGVPDALFCHTGRFIATSKSYEGITKMALLAIEYPVKNNIINKIKSILKR